jgi:hypothetical protein
MAGGKHPAYLAWSILVQRAAAWSRQSEQAGVVASGPKARTWVQSTPPALGNHSAFHYWLKKEKTS